MIGFFEDRATNQNYAHQLTNSMNSFVSSAAEATQEYLSTAGKMHQEEREKQQ